MGPLNDDVYFLLNMGIFQPAMLVYMDGLPWTSQKLTYPIQGYFRVCVSFVGG